MRVTLPAATAAQRAARQHTASFAARGTSCASPAVGSMVPRPRTATWMPAKKGAGKRRQHGSRLSSPEPASSLCRCGSRRLCPGRPRTPLENVRPRGFRVAARWASHAAPVGHSRLRWKERARVPRAPWTNCHNLEAQSSTASLSCSLRVRLLNTGGCRGLGGLPRRGGGLAPVLLPLKLIVNRQQTLFYAGQLVPATCD